jgi:hypothetical protein
MIKAATNKSDAIRELLAKQPNSTPKEIGAALAKNGVKASMALVNKIKYGRKVKRGRKSGKKSDAIRQAWREMGNDARPRDVVRALQKKGMIVSSAHVVALRNTTAPRTPILLEHLYAAKQLADQVGGIDAASRALDALAKLMQN